MSIKSRTAMIAISASIGLLAACSQGGAPETPNASGQSQAASGSAASESAVLTVSPNTVNGCDPNQGVVATVSWHSQNPHVKVMVAGPGQAQPQLFSEGGYAGQAKTGNWVMANTRFQLVDAETGKQLAEQTVKATKCN